MNKFNLPRRMIELAKTLYENAHTRIMINGILSNPFRVTRGVRQGDPWSCLLFDVAIESLSGAIRKSRKIGGFKIPGHQERIINTLFADNTTIFLNEFDEYGELEKILKTWCKASGGRFNIEKTEILPVGTEEYRAFVIEKRTNHTANEKLPAGTKIAIDGEPCRSLGGWVGNLKDEVNIWAKTIEKTKTRLKNWNKSHPTLKGKKHIIQMFVGGMSQYLTTVQGMPKEIKSETISIIRKFIWNGKAPKVSLEQMYMQIEKGGLGITDIMARNEAINLIWVKKYLSIGKDRPMWAYVADELIKKNLPKSGKKFNERLTKNQNPFVQSWAPAMHAGTKLPKDILKFLKTAKKYDVNMEAIRISEIAKKKLPAWYHVATEPSPNGTFKKKSTECLISTHNLRTVDDLHKATRRTRDILMRPRHVNETNCTCRFCEADREKGCEHPNKCCDEANEAIKRIEKKFNPLNKPKIDNLSLTKNRLENNRREREENGYITFDPSIKKDDDITHIIRVFTNPNATCKDPAYRKTRDGRAWEPKEQVWTDGSCLNQGTDEAKTGAGVFFGPDSNKNMAIRVPGESQSNNIGELVGVIKAIEVVTPFTPLDIITDSKHVMDRVTTNLTSWEENGWIGVENKKEFKVLVAKLRARGAPTRFKWIKGHTGDNGNEAADKLAGKGARKENLDQVNLEIEKKFDLTGAQLSKLTQALAYRGIRERKKKPELTRGAKIRIDMTKHAVKEINGNLPTNERIWKSVHHEDFQRQIRIFFWITMHNAQKVGEYWIQKAKNREHWAKCHVCGEDDSIDHILTKCNSPEVRIIWKLAKELWMKKQNKWPEIKNASSILACGLAEFKTADGKKLTGANRLYRILISESDETQPQTSETEIHNKWVKIINLRLELDIALTKNKYNEKAMPRKKVLQTWRNTIENERNLPPDWTRSNGVVVSIRRMERQTERTQRENPG